MRARRALVLLATLCLARASPSVAAWQTFDTGPGFEGVRELDCQPRVLSPKGGGFGTRSAISFELGKGG